MGESNTVVSACTMYRHLQQYCSHPSIGEICYFVKDLSMGESNTVVSSYTLYRHLQHYCSHPSICPLQINKS